MQSTITHGKRSKLFNGKDYLLCIDQYGQKLWAKSVKELIAKAYGTKAAKMYIDSADHNTTYHCGYIVLGRWFSIYKPLRVEA